MSEIKEGGRKDEKRMKTSRTAREGTKFGKSQLGLKPTMSVQKANKAKGKKGENCWSEIYHAEIHLNRKATWHFDHLSCSMLIISA